VKTRFDTIMRRTAIAVAVSIAIGVTPMAVFAQRVERSEAIASSDVLSQISMFSYRDGPKSDLFLRGMPMAANAQGQARVEYQNGNAQISAKVEKMPEPASLGPYTTYVLWTVTPDGRATNQGVIAGGEGGKGDMKTQYGASQFALIVTAEPHFAVSVPSTMIALYNVADDVEGTESKIATLTERADYTNLARIDVDGKTPLEVVQARYAVAIAKNAGADRFALPAYTAATQKLAAAETALLGSRSARKTAPGLGREAAIAGEDARRAGMLASAAAAAEAQRVAAATAAANAASAAAAVAAEAAAASTLAAATLATDIERERSAEEAAMAARKDLLGRLSLALPTRETSRGLVSEIGGVQFATGAASIGGSARENLAKFSGIVASYPTLRLNVEGHTDSTGSAATNNELSLQRAISVRDYLIGQGVAASSIDVAGLGSSAPITDNDTTDSRARNRRVEILLSGGPLATR
jgi:outer membrane protein OmpA-like peptidoglycan-associated protein